ncbi:MAG: hypothetical protein R2860_01870 [Desulfobacterales bacterium]
MEIAVRAPLTLATRSLICEKEMGQALFMTPFSGFFVFHLREQTAQAFKGSVGQAVSSSCRSPAEGLSYQRATSSRACSFSWQ